MGLWSRPSDKTASKRAAEGHCGTYVAIAAFFSVVIYIFFVDFGSPSALEPKMSFVGRSGAQFVVDGRPFYVNGWNSYWLMDQAVEEVGRLRVSEMFQSANNLGLTVCRTWAFNDGAYHALQVSLGRFDERVFQIFLHIKCLLGLCLAYDVGYEDDKMMEGSRRLKTEWRQEGNSQKQHQREVAVDCNSSAVDRPLYNVFPQGGQLTALLDSRTFAMLMGFGLESG